MEKFDIILGALLKEQRIAKGLTSAQVGEKLGITHQMVSKYELGKTPMTANTVVKLSNIYNIKYYEIIEKAGKLADEQI